MPSQLIRRFSRRPDWQVSIQLPPDCDAAVFDASSAGSICHGSNGRRRARLHQGSPARRRVTGHMMGGIGNNMWIYQSLHGIARATSSELLLAETELSKLREVFMLDASAYTNADGVNTSAFAVQNEARYDRFTPFNVTSDTRITGYLQHPGYLGVLAPFPWVFHDSVVEAAKVVLAGHTEWIGVHVRRFPKRHLIDLMVPASAYQAAIDHALQVAAAADAQRCVLVTSNDIPWAKAHIHAPCLRFAPNAFLADPMLPDATEPREAHAENGGRDLAALTMCHTLILTGGSFGYFAGMLHAGGGPVHIYAGSHPVTANISPPAWETFGGDAVAQIAASPASTSDADQGAGVPQSWSVFVSVTKPGDWWQHEVSVALSHTNNMPMRAFIVHRAHTHELFARMHIARRSQRMRAGHMHAGRASPRKGLSPGEAPAPRAGRTPRRGQTA